VLPGHAPFISTVRPGVIDVHDEGSVKFRIFVAGGFAEVTPERLTVLAEEAMPLADIDRGAVEDAVKSLQQELSMAESDAERQRLAAAIAIGEAKLEAVGRA
jgi:F-type H+-transporting ATPase subunit epsilon